MFWVVVMVVVVVVVVGNSLFLSSHVSLSYKHDWLFFISYLLFLKSIMAFNFSHGL